MIWPDRTKPTGPSVLSTEHLGSSASTTRWDGTPWSALGPHRSGIPGSRRARAPMVQARAAGMALATRQVSRPGLIGRAIRVPHPTVNPGPQRTATVNLAGPISWSSLARPARTHPAIMPDKDEVPGSSLARADGHRGTGLTLNATATMATRHEPNRYSAKRSGSPRTMRQ